MSNQIIATFQRKRAEDDDNLGAGRKIAQADRLLAAILNPPEGDDGISVADRLSQAIDLLQQAQKQRAVSPGALGEHGRRTHQVRFE
jgi:hypothetical protein